MNPETGQTAMQPDSSRQCGSSIRFSVAGLIALCSSLVVTSILATHFLAERHDSGTKPALSAARNSVPITPASEENAWGDLTTLDVEIQQPEEYVSFDATANLGTMWVFPASSLNHIKELLAGCGLSEDQIGQTMEMDRRVSTAEATTLKPSAELVLSLTPECRGKLYGVLSKWPENHYMQQPYHLPGNFAVMAARSGVSSQVIDLIAKLTYENCGIKFFSDPGLVLTHISSPAERLLLLKALTYQTAVLARLHLKPNSDIDKIVGYWGSVPGVRAKDLRPLVESVVHSPEGGTISLLYLLPAFARERLYTFPLPGEAGDTLLDCHWTALNFLNSTPDDRLQDAAFASNYVKENFYPIGKPAMCGDVMFVLDPEGGVIHSAVYIADDIVFTKNGSNFAQPWILMRMKNLLNVYTLNAEPKAVFYRRKDT